jgi:hypothetical protein
LWLSGVIVLGRTVGRFSLGHLVYSLDRTLPGLRLVRTEELAPTLNSAAEAWFAVQTTAGWLVALVIIGWLASLY